MQREPLDQKARKFLKGIVNSLGHRALELHRHADHERWSRVQPGCPPGPSGLSPNRVPDGISDGTLATPTIPPTSSGAVRTSPRQIPDYAWTCDPAA